MPMFKVKTARFDPYRTYPLHVFIDGKMVAAFHQIYLLKPPPDKGNDRSRAGPHASETSARIVSLHRGITLDPGFEAWAQQDAAPDEPVARAVAIRLLSLNGQPATAYELSDARVLEWRGVPDLDSIANAIAIASLRISCGALTTRLLDPVRGDDA